MHVVPNKAYCFCRVEGDTHYKTFDGKLINFFGTCKYRLAQYSGSNKKCNFKILLRTAHRKRSTLSTYTKYVDIILHRHRLRLYRGKRLFVDGVEKYIPYLRTNSVHVFKSNNQLQLVAVNCGIKVSFDGASNAILMARRSLYGSHLSGVCGNCDGSLRDEKHVDINKFAVRRHCPKAPVLKRPYCTGQWEFLVRSSDWCGSILDTSGPFSGCIASGHVNVKDYFKECEMDVCANRFSKAQSRRRMCRVFQAMADNCASHGFGHLAWRRKLDCPANCGRNKYYRASASACPLTCESKLFGAVPNCKGVPRREGCVCKPGYYLDGESCVLLKNCKAIRQCGDTQPINICRKWKAQGFCRSHKLKMKSTCGSTCGFCSLGSARTSVCKDVAGSTRCSAAYNNGQCQMSLYRKICSFTCYRGRCPCPVTKTVRTRCHPHLKIRTIKSITYYRNSAGVCQIRTRTKVITCGKCRYHKRYIGRCNYCTGRRKVTISYRIRINLRCRSRRKHAYLPCSTCPKKLRTTSQCRAHRYIRTINYFYERRGCFRCVARKTVTQKAVYCASNHKVVGLCDPRNCYSSVAFVKFLLFNCRCQKSTIKYYRRCCCRGPTYHTHCQNNILFRVKTLYVFRGGFCRHRRFAQVIRKECPVDKSYRGKCSPYKCVAYDTTLSYYKKRCQCVTFRTTTARTCCCAKPRKRTFCYRRRGIIATHTTYYQLVRRRLGAYCEEKTRLSTKVVRCRVGVWSRARYDKLSCHQSSCIRKIRKSWVKRIGCKCKRFTSHSVETCCCRKYKRVRTTCSRGYKSVTVIILSKMKSNRCFVYQLEKTIKTIRCRRPVVRCAVCQTGMLSSSCLNIHFSRRNCRCVRRTFNTSQRCGCHLRKKRSVIGQCIRGKCRKPITSWRINHQSCSYYKVKRTVRCTCCHHEEKKSFCDFSRGRWVTYHKTFIWNGATRSCYQRQLTRYSKVFCRRIQRIHRSTCGSAAKYRQTETILTQERLGCRCAWRRESRIKYCSCPETYNGPWKCAAERYVRSVLYWRLSGGRCIRHSVRQYRYA